MGGFWITRRQAAQNMIGRFVSYHKGDAGNGNLEYTQFGKTHVTESGLSDTNYVHDMGLHGCAQENSGPLNRNGNEYNNVLGYLLMTWNIKNHITMLLMSFSANSVAVSPICSCPPSNGDEGITYISSDGAQLMSFAAGRWYRGYNIDVRGRSIPILGTEENKDLRCIKFSDKFVFAVPVKLEKNYSFRCGNGKFRISSLSNFDGNRTALVEARLAFGNKGEDIYLKYFYNPCVGITEFSFQKEKLDRFGSTMNLRSKLGFLADRACLNRL